MAKLPRLPIFAVLAALIQPLAAAADWRPAGSKLDYIDMPATSGPGKTTPQTMGDPLDLGPEYSAGGLWDNAYFFSVTESFGLNAQTGLEGRIGGRIGTNWGFPLIDDSSGLGAQFGGSATWADGGEQFFLTTGLFYRADAQQEQAFSIGAVLDWLDERNDEVDLFQIRLKVSRLLDSRNEVGIWGATPLSDDTTDDLNTARTVSQANLFYHHLCPDSWDISGWIGWRDEPRSAAIGTEVFYPLHPRWGLTTGGHYAFQAETWHAFAGAVWFPGSRAQQQFIGQNRHLPFLPVANNSSMTLAVQH